MFFIALHIIIIMAAVIVIIVIMVMVVILLSFSLLSSLSLSWYNCMQSAKATSPLHALHALNLKLRNTSVETLHRLW